MYMYAIMHILLCREMMKNNLLSIIALGYHIHPPPIGQIRDMNSVLYIPYRTFRGQFAAYCSNRGKWYGFVHLFSRCSARIFLLFCLSSFSFTLFSSTHIGTSKWNCWRDVWWEWAGPLLGTLLANRWEPTTTLMLLMDIRWVADPSRGNNPRSLYQWYQSLRSLYQRYQSLDHINLWCVMHESKLTKTA